MKVVLDLLGAPASSGGMRAYAEELLRTWHDLPACLAGPRDDDAATAQSTCNPLLARTATFLDTAKASGDVGADVDAERTFELVLALAWATDRFHHDEATARRQVALATAGLFV